MGIRIHEILEEDGGYVLARISHGGQEIVARVFGRSDTLLNYRGALNVELNYQKVVSAKLLPDFDDDDACILKENERFIVKGRVSNILEIGKESLVDIYISTGPEYLAVLRSEFQEAAQGEGAELEVLGLCYYPVYY
jgi:hypothetical protein